MRKKTTILVILLQIVLLPLVSATAIFIISPQASPINANGPYDRAAIAIGAGLAVGLSSIGAGIAISSTGTAAITALTEKPETFFRSFLVVAIAEAIAIYGLIIAILLWLLL